MLGKTNILFVSKNEASKMQLVYEKYLTEAVGRIRKIEYINNMFFAYTSDKEVLRGTDVNSLEFIKKDNENLTATHFIYHDGKYYFCNSYAVEQEKGIVYATEDFINYEEIVIEEDVYTDTDKKLSFSVNGIFKDSKNRVVVMISEMYFFNSKIEIYKVNLHFFNSLEQLSNKKMAVCDDSDIVKANAENSFLLKDRIFIRREPNVGDKRDFICDLSGNCKNFNSSRDTYANDYFFRHTCKQAGTYDEPNYIIDKIYRSFNGLDWSECTSSNMNNVSNWINTSSAHLNYKTPIFAINGKTCLIYRDGKKLYANIADSVNKIGDSANPAFEIDLLEFNQIESVCEDNDGNTYLGFTGGIIIKCYLDQDGTTKLPDVQLVKTLAAKQALAQAKQYTDEKVAELKAYVDSKIEQNAETTEVQG